MMIAGTSKRSVTRITSFYDNIVTEQVHDISEVSRWFHLPDRSKSTHDAINHIRNHVEENRLDLFKSSNFNSVDVRAKKTASTYVACYLNLG